MKKTNLKKSHGSARLRWNVWNILLAVVICKLEEEYGIK